MRRRLFRDIICAVTGPGTPPPNRDDAAPCGGFLIPSRDPSAAGVSAALGTSAAPTTSFGRGGGGDAHKSERFLLSFAGSELSCHLRHVDAKRAEAMEGLIALLYDRVDGRFSRPDLARILSPWGLGVDVGGGGRGVRVA